MSMYSQHKSPRMLRTVSELMPDTFSDFIGEVCYFKPEYNYSGNKAVLAMTDYTQHEKLPFQEGHGKVNGKSTILVTLWDEHLETALNLNVGVGQLLYLKNMLCKLNKNDTIELRMNGFRPGKGYHISDPIKVLGQKDPAAIELRTRQAKYRQAQVQRTENSMDTVHSQTIVEEAPLSQTTTMSALALSTNPTPTLQTSSESITLKKEVVSPQKPQTPPIKRYISKVPSPVFQFGAASVSPTLVLTEKVRQEHRNLGGNQKSVRYLRMQACVVDFAPKQIIDFSVPNCNSCTHIYGSLSDSKIPPKCPGCQKEATYSFKYYFMLTLMDEFQQTYDVHVDNDGARTLLGPPLGDAGNFNKHLARFEGLQEKLRRIGIIQGNPTQGQPIYFDCCIRLTRTQHSQSSVVPMSPEAEHYHCYEGEPNDYSGDDIDKEEVANTETSTQPMELLSQEKQKQKRRVYDELVKNGKRPKHNCINATSNRGLLLQGLESDASHDFRATLVYTVIN
ncbi:hypothetical protein BGX27_011212 [Mortierella sp. AM989]|nr:hypothetical protein BGX27_011212 [Mortierella sp. AM989]